MATGASSRPAHAAKGFDLVRKVPQIGKQPGPRVKGMGLNQEKMWIKDFCTGRYLVTARGEWGEYTRGYTELFQLR